MKALHVKLLRDLVARRGQATAIGLVMACGVATFVMSLSMLDSLTATLDDYYTRTNFAHVFAHLKRAPERAAERIETLPGVAEVRTRVMEQVTLDLPGLREPASGRIVSLPPDPRRGLSRLHLRTGRFPEAGGRRDVLVSHRFARAHDLRPDDVIEVVLNGRLESLHVAGVALSPEYIYLIGPGSVLPEDERFGVFWMTRPDMEAAFDMTGAFNDVQVRLAPGASAADVIARIDDVLEPYGGLGAYDRSDQVSNQFVENEIRELRGMVVITPIIFLGVAAFLLNMVLARMVSAQREQIAALKALGYGDGEIARHYLGFVMLITVLAVAVGVAAGAWMGNGLTAMYASFFDFPSFQYQLRGRVVLFGLVVSVAAASVGVISAVRSAVRLPPAEAMRPQAPPSFRPTLLERAGLHRIASPAARMVLRHLERRPVKTSISILGVALATSIVVVGSYTEDAVDFLLDFQFNRVQRYDVELAFTDQTDDAVLSSVRALPGVLEAEPHRGLAVRIQRGHVERRLGVIGLDRADGLYHLLDVSGRPVALPEKGIVLSSLLAERLGVEVGGAVRVEALEGRRPVFSVPVTGLIDDFSGLSAYMSRAEMNRLMREPNVVSGVYVRTDPADQARFFEKLRETPRVAAVNVKATIIRNFRETISRSLALMRPFLLGFAVIIAFGVVYNSARISLSERSRDLATLRVLGFTRREIAAIQLGELAIITLIAIPVGLGLGRWLAWSASEAAGSELVRIPFHIEPSTYGYAAIVTLGASLTSALIVRGRINDLDLISVLKARE